VTVAIAVALLAGCGYGRTQSPGPLGPPGVFTRLQLSNVGVSVRAPSNWTRLLGPGPLFDQFVAGRANVSLWRYRRSAPPPTSLVAVARLRAALLGAVRARDPHFVLIRSKLARVFGAYAVVLDGIETIFHSRRRVRSFHVYVRGGEIVLDEYAPIASFHAIDRAVFSPLYHSLKLLRSSG
jgi:hypothetical protein